VFPGCFLACFLANVLHFLGVTTAAHEHVQAGQLVLEEEEEEWGRVHVRASVAHMRSRVLPRLSASLCVRCVCVAWAVGAACLKVVSE
jgi:hypothetical protein